MKFSGPFFKGQAWPFISPIDCPKKSVTNYQYMLPDISEEPCHIPETVILKSFKNVVNAVHSNVTFSVLLGVHDKNTILESRQLLIKVLVSVTLNHHS